MKIRVIRSGRNGTPNSPITTAAPTPMPRVKPNMMLLGRLALKEGDPKAADWFQKTRALAREGFADSLGMAADSYGWEGRSEWKQEHPGKAAALFLRQLALGDESAIV